MEENSEYDRFGQNALSASVLVLNRFYSAINVISAKRAFVLLFKDLVEALDYHDEQLLNFKLPDWIEHSEKRLVGVKDHEQFVRTPRCVFMVPRVIRLRNCQEQPKHDVKFTKKNVLVRDNHKCQYCGKRSQASKLTVDHIIPKSRGGRSVWTNIVSACHDCNIKKGGKLPWEVGMKLSRQPTVPRRNPLIMDRIDQSQYKMWGLFLSEFKS